MKLVVNDREVDFPTLPSDVPDDVVGGALGDVPGRVPPAPEPAGPTVAALVSGLGYPDHGIAVAVDAAVVPRSQWATAVLRPGVRVDVVTAVQGG